MGMFDSIKCEYPLEVPELAKKVPGFNIDEITFQTKDLENLLEHYTITKDGELLRTVSTYEWVDDDSAFLKGYLEEKSSKVQKVDFHGIVEFYCYEDYLDESDKTNPKNTTVSIDYNAYFTKGKLDEIKVARFEVSDTTEHWKRTQSFFEDLKIERNKWYNKYIFYTKVYSYFKKYILQRPFYYLHQATGKIYYWILKTF